MAFTLVTISLEELTEMVSRKLLETHSSTNGTPHCKNSKRREYRNSAGEFRENAKWIQAAFGGRS